MKRTLKIEIDCEEKTCGECPLWHQHLRLNKMVMCDVFVQILKYTSLPDVVFRCDACKNAEVVDCRVKVKCVRCAQPVWASEVQMHHNPGGIYYICNTCKNVEVK